MKTVYLSIAMVSAVLSFTSCEDNNLPGDDSQSGPFEITITGEMGGFETCTKSSVESVVRMKWNTTTADDEKDIVWVYGSDGSSFKSLSAEGLKATSSEENPYTATLKGIIDEVPSDGNLYLVHCPSGTYDKPDVSVDGSVSIDMSAVKQDAGVTPFIIYSTVNVSETGQDDLVARFSFATTVVQVNLTGLEANAGLTVAAVSGINKTCSLSFNGGAVTLASAAAIPTGSDLGTFTKALSGEATPSGKATFFLGVPAMSAVSDRNLIVIADGKFYSDDEVLPGAHPANNYVNTICCCNVSYLIPGKFSVSATKQVQFTRGNLYWDGTAYHFESSQTACPVNWNPRHVSHFFWTSLTDYQSANASYMPYAESYSYGSRSTGDKFFCGEENPFIVDGVSSLYALSKDEWTYLFRTRANYSSLCKYGVTVTTNAGTAENCVVIAPDGYTGEISDSYDAAAWAAAEASGLVCLPAGGYRNGLNPDGVGSCGSYWSATPDEVRGEYAYDLLFNDSCFCPDNGDNRSVGYSVRLVSTVAIAAVVTPGTTGTAKAIIGGSEVDVGWVQLWQDGPKFAVRNVGMDADIKGSVMAYSEVDTTGTGYVWGGNWKIPSMGEMELLNESNVSCVYCQENGVWGFKFTGVQEGYTANSLFLPAFNGNSIRGDAYYWSSTAWAVDPQRYMFSLYLGFNSSYNGTWVARLKPNWQYVRPVLRN